VSALSRVQAVQRRIRSVRDNIFSLRESFLYVHQRFLQDACLISREMPEPEPPRVAFVPHSDLIEEPPPHPLINAVKQRLKVLQEQRDEELQNSVSFLQSIIQSEKRRVRAEANAK
jgi:hypothetical protein